jgi:hypothetical protein
MGAVGAPLQNFLKVEGFTLCRCNVGEEACKLGRQIGVEVFCSGCHAGSAGGTEACSVGRAGRCACLRSLRGAGGCRGWGRSVSEERVHRCMHAHRGHTADVPFFLSVCSDPAARVPIRRMPVVVTDRRSPIIARPTMLLA